MWTILVCGLFWGLVVVESKYPEVNSPATVKEFNTWKLQHGKVYADENELWERYYIFLDNLKIINALNNRPKKSFTDPVQFGLNQFADMTVNEFHQKILLPPKRPIEQKHNYHRGSNRTMKTPASYDWTAQKDVVTSVKDQGQVGTCWAFAGCANVESLWAIKTGKASPHLSTQALNDCDGIHDLSTSAIACGPLGATMPGFYEYVINEGGLMTWEDYPYCVGDGSCAPCSPSDYSKEMCGAPWPISPCFEEDSCAAKYDTSKFLPGLKVKDYTSFSSNEKTLRDDLVNTGPLVAGIDATDLQFYEGGVLEPVLCNSVILNHAVLLTGYDQTEDGVDYWMFKNSWGTQWGEKGFGRIIRGQDACGINVDVSSAILG